MTTPNLKRYVSRHFDHPTIIGDDGSEGGGGYINEIDVDESFDRHLRRQVGRFEVNSPPPRQNNRRHDRGGGGGGGVKRGVDNDGFVIVNLDRDDGGCDTAERNNIMNAAYPVLSTPPSKPLPPTINGPAALSSQGDDELSLASDEETSAGSQRRKNIIFATSIKQEKLNKFHGVSFEQTNDDSSNDETKQKVLSGQSDKSDGKQEDEEVEDPWHDCLVWTLIGLTCLLVLAACYMAIYLYWLWPSLSDPLTLYAVQKTIVEFVVFVLAVLFVNSLIILRIFP